MSRRIADRQATLHEVRMIAAEPVAAGEAVTVIPLRRLDSLPEGALFAARNGRTSVEARRRGDELIVVARSDSLRRSVTRYERTDGMRRFEADSAVRCTADSVRDERLSERASCVAEQDGIIEERRSPVHRGRWFGVGLAVGVLLVLLVRRAGFFRKKSVSWGHDPR